VQGAPYCLNRSPESKEDIQQKNRAGGEVDAKFEKRGRFKKLEGNNGGDLHASEHRYQNDQPIPELPEPGGRLGRGSCSFVGVHFFGGFGEPDLTK